MLLNVGADHSTGPGSAASMMCRHVLDGGGRLCAISPVVPVVNFTAATVTYRSAHFKALREAASCRVYVTYTLQRLPWLVCSRWIPPAGTNATIELQVGTRSVVASGAGQY